MCPPLFINRMKNDAVARIAVSGVSYWFDKPYSYAIPDKFIAKVRPGMRVVIPFGGKRPREGLVLAMGGDQDRPLKSILDILDEEPLLTEGQMKLALWMRERFFCTVMEAVKTILPAGLWYKVSPSYALAPGWDRDTAYSAAGKSKQEALILDAVLLHEGECPLADIEAAFGNKNPGSALLSLVNKGVLVTEAIKQRRGRDRSIQKVRLAVSPEEAAAAIESNRRAVRQASILRVLCDMEKASLADLCYFTGAGRDAVKRLADKGLVEIFEEELLRRPEYEKLAAAPLPVLNKDQQSAFEGILALTDKPEANVALLFGVTGSGKTTIYIRLIDEVLKKGKSAILLVPEIALTPQMLKSFSSHFGDNIAVLHSALSMGERYDEWKRIRSGAAKLVIGTRSAVFAPVRDLGIIIMDEEQEDTYKSENASRYHARDVAKYLCLQAGATLLLGSATPDICSRYSAETGKYSFFTLPGRYNAMKLPAVKVVDMKQELQGGNGGIISSLLRKELQENMDRGEQSILFLNRRGTNKLVTCTECGFTYECPNCSCSLTYHSYGNRLMCHYCGHSQTPDPACPECGGKFNYVGAGTQKVVEELEALFPGVPVLRMDTDSVSPSDSHGTLLEKFRTQRIPIMVGTQMVTKGLNFENVTLVGVLTADQSLYAGDYRAAERSFSLITQVIGRSGRFEKPGRAIIQTYTPENQVIRLAARQDYEGFYRAELELRRYSGSPPFCDLFVLTAAGEDEAAVLRCCADLRLLLLQETAVLPETEVLGPAPMPIARLNKTWRYRVTIRSGSGPAVRRIVSAALLACNNDKKYKGVSVYADFNPLN